MTVLEWLSMTYMLARGHDALDYYLSYGLAEVLSLQWKAHNMYPQQQTTLGADCLQGKTE